MEKKLKINRKNYKIKLVYYVPNNGKNKIKINEHQKQWKNKISLLLPNNGKIK